MATQTKTKPLAVITKITPDKAKNLLSGNSHNRPIRNKYVEYLQGVLTRGEWQMNGDAIRVAYDGTLLDGQHRLWAVVETGIPIETLLITGLDLDTQETMDVGVKRNLADALKLRGESNSYQLAAAINYLYRYLRGSVRDVNNRPTIAQALTTLEENPTIRDAVNRTQAIRNRFHINVGVAAAAYYEFDSIDSEACAEFFHKLYTGADLTETNPILVLRAWLENHAVTGSARSDAVITHAMIIKAWNFWREGKKVDRIIWKATGIKAEQFPEAHN